MADTPEFTKTITDLKKRIAKLEKEIKKHQIFIDNVSRTLWLFNPLIFHSLSHPASKIKNKKTSLTARLKGKKSEI